METDDLDKFIGEIIDAKQLPGLDGEVRNQVHKDLMNGLTDQINLALINALPNEKADELNVLLDNENVTDEQIKQFMESSGVDTRQVATQTMLKFRDLYLNVK